MEDNVQLLIDAVIKLKSDLVVSLKNAGRSATGQTEQSLDVIKIGNDRVQLTAPAYFYALETGRKPTSPNAATGDPTVYEQILLWCAAKGIDASAARPITTNIHKFGYPGKPGVISEPLSDDNVNSEIDKALGAMAELYTTQILEGLNIPQTELA